MKSWTRSTLALRNKAEWLDVLDRHCGVGLWDAVLHEGDAMHPSSRWTWSSEFRRLCGYDGEAEFPNVVQSWSDRLHPDDAAPTFAAFGEALKTGGHYDVTYRLRIKDGSFRWFRATGGVIKDAKGIARRACGSLVDVHDATAAEEARRIQAETLTVRFQTEVLAVVDHLAQAAAALSRDTVQMASAAAQTSEHSSAVTVASDKASQNVQGVASATREMAVSIEKITQQVALSARATEGTAAEAAAATDAVRTLVDDVRQIGEVVGLIRSVAGQTNLLALNATIEAARAGDAGKGFAVVASEVKALAGQTAKATENISARIQAIQAATSKVEKSIAGVATTIAQLGEVSMAISAAVNQQGVATSAISRGVQDAARGTEVVSSGMNTVSSFAADAGDISGRIARSVDHLTGQAGGLRAQVDKFLDKLRAA